MKKPTAQEVAAEVAILQEMKPRIPRCSKFGDNNHEQIQAQIDFLNGDIDTTAEEFNELSLPEQSAAIEAEQWKDGTGSAVTLSESWRSLVA